MGTSMIYLEMARDEDHGGGTWAFTNCVWAPIKKTNGSTWPFWSKVLEIREGDTVIHLRGVSDPCFVGYSIASGNGFQTTRRPPDPGEWDFAEAFFRADLTGFVPFYQPINLAGLFVSRSDKLTAYFDSNKKREKKRRTNIFFVRQSGRLQCLNGAYLSEIDDELSSALFGDGTSIIEPVTRQIVVSVQTGSQITTIRSRLGQSRFSSEIKRLYGNACCFPGCGVSDDRFLVGSHIARWSDNVDLRGNMGNGLCLCVMHDRAFEIGLFSLDQHHRVFVNPRDRKSKSVIVQALMIHNGEGIRLSEVTPLDDALLEHWIRVGIEP
jgi:putative restriction endonuclease